ncbi:MAG: glycosyltransferase family 4 protein [Planctomycetota bacterium]
MKIAILSYEYPPDTGYGGIGTYSWYQARALAKIGHDVHVFAGSRQPGVFHSEHEGVRVTRVLEKGWFRGIVDGLRNQGCGWGSNRAETAFGAYHALRAALEKESFDMVEFPECGADGLLVSTLLPVATCVKFHSPARLIMGIYDTPKDDQETTAFLEQIAINQATLRTSCSLFLAEEVVSKMNVRRPVHVVPNGIDLELFDKDEGIDVKERFGLPPKDGLTVFFANRLERRKGIHLVREMCFHVMQKYPHVHFAFAGDDNFGVLKNEIAPFIEKHRLQNRFRYFGKLQLPEVRAILKRIDIHLIPSLWENAPYSCLEAMSAGRAIVASDCGGLPEMIQDGRNGMLARNDDVKSYITALEKVIEDKALRERIGAEARRTIVQRYTDVGIARQTVDVYRRELVKAR